MDREENGLEEKRRRERVLLSLFVSRRSRNRLLEGAKKYEASPFALSTLQISNSPKREEEEKKSYWIRCRYLTLLTGMQKSFFLSQQLNIFKAATALYRPKGHKRPKNGQNIHKR